MLPPARTRGLAGAAEQLLGLQQDGVAVVPGVGARHHVASSAATIALIAPADEESRNSIQYDLGQATMSMLLAPTDLGIGCGHSAVQDQALAREILGFPADRYCAYLIALGYPADRPLRPIERPNRPPLHNVVRRETW